MRVELPFKVYIHSHHAAVTVRRNGKCEKITSRYFATKEEAVKFCGDEKRVLYRPGEAHTERPVETPVQV